MSLSRRLPTRRRPLLEALEDRRAPGTVLDTLLFPWLASFLFEQPYCKLPTFKWRSQQVGRPPGSRLLARGFPYLRARREVAP
jgi:hypothetical protein